MTLILASTSPYRRMLLERLGIPFRTQSPGTDEAQQDGEPPAARAARLALAKAQAVAPHHPGAVVVGSDQVAACGATVLHKPGNAEQCRAQLARLSGTTAHFYTACALVGAGSGAPQTHLDTTTVRFRILDPAEIERYVERERPFDCAGGFKSEGLGIALLESIDSRDPSALIGLPLIWLAAALRRAGYELP